MCKNLIEAKYNEYREKICYYLTTNFISWCEVEPFLPLDIYHDSLTAIWIYSLKGNEIDENFIDRNIFKVSRRKMLDYIKSKQREKKKEKQFFGKKILMEQIENHAHDDDEIVRNILLIQCRYELYQKYLNKLGDICLCLLTNREQGYDWSSIAEICKISGEKPSIKARQNADECKKRLKKLVEKDKSCDQFKV